MATLVSIAASFGIAQFSLKTFGREGWDGRRWLIPSPKWLFFTPILALSVMYIWAFWGPHDATNRTMLFIMGLFVVGQVIIKFVSAKFQLEERYVALSWWQLLPNLSRLLIFGNNFFGLYTQIHVLDVTLFML